MLFDKFPLKDPWNLSKRVEKAKSAVSHIHLATPVHDCRRLVRLFQNVPSAPATISSDLPGTSKCSQTRWAIRTLLSPASTVTQIWRLLTQKEQKVSSKLYCRVWAAKKKKKEAVPSFVKQNFTFLQNSTQCHKSHHQEAVSCCWWEGSQRWLLVNV